MTLGFERLFTVRWTDRIEREWLDALARNRPDLLFDQLSRRRRGCGTRFPMRGWKATKSTKPCSPRRTQRQTRRRWRHRVRAGDNRDMEHQALCRRRTRSAQCHGERSGCLPLSTFEREPVDTFAATAKAFSFLKRPDGRPAGRTISTSWHAIALKTLRRC